MDQGEYFETAIVNVDTPYIKGNQVQALCIENPEYDLVVGDVLGARCPCNPNRIGNWTTIRKTPTNTNQE